MVDYNDKNFMLADADKLPYEVSQSRGWLIVFILTAGP
jgi:hypothetical protein